MCASVPQSPTADTRTSTSYVEITGRGTSRTSIRPISHKTLARILGPVVAVSPFLLIKVEALTEPHSAFQATSGCLTIGIDIAGIQSSCIAQSCEALHRLQHTNLERS